MEMTMLNSGLIKSESWMITCRLYIHISVADPESGESHSFLKILDQPLDILHIVLYLS